ncbi:MAG: hypothetical protein AVDCRST_MAG35-1053 [uncultured Quadrisphaera sp.]|uniref:General stress protein 17M-like domain-containing protein n=1 Tax=uncultured Quadrisphaera sp. TaxID=904978 RepID=A0A6J4P1Q4_9ACTN|nr:MAG: hypothetical protein AVDCRST_MAG35-1053 [uncultured Quadrisphaera sp.]
MSATRAQPGRGPAVGLPRGVEIASYSTYLEAQRAVDHLSDEGFPVQHTAIVGTDLRSVERVTGRLTYARVALAGAASGVWFGVFAGLLLSLFAPSESGLLGIVVSAALIGAAFGILFAIISYALTRGRRDFSSVNAIMASRYSVLCAEESGRARELLSRLEGVRPLGTTAPPDAPQV